jgi:hypothetical protein
MEPHIVSPEWLAWAASEMIGAADPDRPSLSCLVHTPPQETGEPDDDIPMLWAWATTAANRKDPRWKVARVVAPRLGRWSLDAVTSPYVFWRFDQLNALIGAPDVAEAHPAPPPTRLAGLNDLLDLWGHAERCAAHPVLCVAGGVPDFQAVADLERVLNDDLGTAAAIAIARLEGNDAEVARYRESLRDRVDSATGLIRRERPQGDIDSTFLVLQMAPDLVAGPASEETVRRLRHEIGRVSRRDAATRMKGVAILKAMGGAWSAYRREMHAAVGELAANPIVRSSLRSKIGLLEALHLLDAGVPRVRLEIFAIGDDRSRELARLALVHADLFANDAEIRAAFADLREELRKESGLQGCRLNGVDYAHLFRSAMEDRESCSLDATWRAVRSGSAFGAPS